MFRCLEAAEVFAWAAWARLTASPGHVWGMIDVPLMGHQSGTAWLHVIACWIVKNVDTSMARMPTTRSAAGAQCVFGLRASFWGDCQAPFLLAWPTDCSQVLLPQR